MSTNTRTTHRLFIRYSSFVIYLLSIVYCLLFTLFCSAQEKSEVLKYARAVVDTLASPSMHGRGYVMKGDSIAADYIKKEFEKFGMKPVGKEFYQRFSFPVNTFPGDMEVKLDKQKLIPGKDFIVDGSSGECNGTYRIKFITDTGEFDRVNVRKFIKKAIVS